MIPTSSKISASIGIFALLVTMFITSPTAAQTQDCYCNDSVSYVRVRRAPVRRVAYRAKVGRTRHYARVRTNYRRVYVPRSRVASYVAYDDTPSCYTPTSRVVVTEPVVDTTYVTERAYTSRYDIDRIARGWGHRDGFKDGWKAALKNRDYSAENNHDFRDADNGYKRRFGSKFLYKTSYRDGYVRGYDAGFRSVAGTSEIRY